MAKVSERFGSVLRMPPIYRWFYVAEFFASIAALAHLIQASTYLAQSTGAQDNPRQLASLEVVAIFHHIPLAIAVTIGLLVAWKYWGWLITDRKR